MFYVHNDNIPLNSYVCDVMVHWSQFMIGALAIVGLIPAYNKNR